MGRASGRIEVFQGPMYAGKTDALIRRLEQAEARGTKTLALKPRIDTRVTDDRLVSHSGRRHRAVAVSSGRAARATASGYDFVAIDEAQFFDDGLVQTLRALRADGTEVIVAGLDLDFRGQPFGPMSAIVDLADRVVRLYSRCGRCGRRASLSQRLRDGRPAAESEETIVLGGPDIYSPRCERCFVTERDLVLAGD